MRRTAKGAVAVMCMCCAGCVLPARSTDAFRGKALATSTTVESAVGTAVLTGELATRGRITAAYASVGFSEAETDASGAQTAFDSIQPPNAASDRVRAELDPILSDAVDTLTSMRITARRGELDRLTDDIAAARRISARLSNFQQANQ